jgi:hypothetical protein
MGVKVEGDGVNRPQSGHSINWEKPVKQLSTDEELWQMQSDYSKLLSNTSKWHVNFKEQKRSESLGGEEM